MDAYKVTRDFESALAIYTGAPFAVALNSGTAALLLAVKWQFYEPLKSAHPYRSPHSALGDTIQHHPEVNIPTHTYISVPQAIIHAGGRPTFRYDKTWRGTYQLKPLPVWDSARRFTSGMYIAGQFQCVSFAAAKILGAEQGGAVLHDNPEFDVWARRMRFDGRTEGIDPLEDTFDLIGMHCIMIPSVAATLLVRLSHLPKHNEDLPHYVYPDLSKAPAFK